MKIHLILKIRKIYIGFFLSTIFLTIISVAFRPFIPLFIYNVILAMILYPLVIYFVFKRELNPKKILHIIIGVFLSIVVLIISESILISSTLKIFHISLETAYNNDIVRILISLPVRTFQVLVIIALSKIRKISFYSLKFSTEDLIQTVLYGLLIISSMISVETGLKNIERDYKTITTLIINVFIIVLFSAWIIYKLFKLKTHSILSRKIHDFELERIKSLLKEGYTEHVIELIEQTLKERGK